MNILTSNYNHFLTKRPPHGKRYNFETIQDVLFCWVDGLNYTNPGGLKRILSWLHFTVMLMFVPKNKLVKPDVIIFSSTGLFPLLTAWMYKKRYKAKLITETRDVWPMTLLEVGKISRRHPLIKVLGWLEKFMYNSADVAIGTMPNLSRRIREVTDKDVPFAFIPQGIDLDFIKTMVPMAKDFEEKYFLPGKFTIGYAGTIGTSNALENLFSAAILLQSEISDLQVIILGDGARKKEFEDKFGHLPFIRFASKIPKQAVNAFLTKCDLLYDGVYPARVYDYGLSRNKWIDYMYSGTPMIAAYSGHLSMINEAGCGDAVPVDDVPALADAIRKYYRMSPEDRYAIGQKGKAFILANHTFDHLAALYEDAMDRAKSR